MPLIGRYLVVGDCWGWIVDTFQDRLLIEQECIKGYPTRDGQMGIGQEQLRGLLRRLRRGGMMTWRAMANWGD